MIWQSELEHRLRQVSIKATSTEHKLKTGDHPLSPSPIFRHVKLFKMKPLCLPPVARSSKHNHAAQAQERVQNGGAHKHDGGGASSFPSASPIPPLCSRRCLCFPLTPLPVSPSPFPFFPPPHRVTLPSSSAPAYPSPLPCPLSSPPLPETLCCQQLPNLRTEILVHHFSDVIRCQVKHAAPHRCQSIPSLNLPLPTPSPRLTP